MYVCMYVYTYMYLYTYIHTYPPLSQVPLPRRRPASMREIASMFPDVFDPHIIQRLHKACNAAEMSAPDFWAKWEKGVPDPRLVRMLLARRASALVVVQLKKRPSVLSTLQQRISALPLNFSLLTTHCALSD